MITKPLALALARLWCYTAAGCSITVGPALAAAPFVVIDGAVEMTHAELANARGGFVAPGGFEIAVGVDVTSLARQAAAQGRSGSQVAFNSSAALPTQTFGLTSGGQISSVADPINPVAGSLLQNTLNNATIQQIRQINITLSNYTQIQALTGATAAQLAQQTSFGQLSGLR